jgi:hypothetical protein
LRNEPLVNELLRRNCKRKAGATLGAAPAFRLVLRYLAAAYFFFFALALALFAGAFFTEAAALFIGFFADFLAGFFFAAAFLAAGRLAAFFAAGFFEAAFFRAGAAIAGAGAMIIGLSSTGAIAIGVMDGIPSSCICILRVDISNS